MTTTAQQAPGITRVDLQQHDLGIPGARGNPAKGKPLLNLAE